MRVVAWKSIKVIGRHERRMADVGGRADIHPGDTIVGYVPLSLIQIADRQLRGAVHADREGRCNTDAPRANHVSAGRTSVLRHARHAKGGLFLHRNVQGGGDALETVSTYTHGRVRKFIHPRLLADLLDGAARGAAAEQYRGRAGEHFHRFQIERIAIVTAEVQLTIEIHVVTRGKAPDLNIGTLAVVVIRMCADARIVAKHVA